MATTLGVPAEVRTAWGSNLRRARERAGISQAELAALIECTRQAVSNWERGTSAPSYSMQVALARALRRTVSRLFPAA